MEKNKSFTRTIADTAENVIHSGPCRVYAISPEATTTGTITLRDDSGANGDAAAIKHVCAIGLTQTGKNLGGVLFAKGLTAQLSAGGTDRVGITWEAV